MKSITVQGTQTHNVDVTLTPYDRNKIAVEYIQEAMNIRKLAFISDGKLKYEWEQSYGSHSDWETETVRDATPEDEAALIVIEHLQSLTYK